MTWPRPPKGVTDPRFQLASIPGVSPLRAALTLSAIYLVACVLYIWISGRIAARMALDVADLRTIELVKGTAFVLVSSLLVFALSWTLLRRIEARTLEIEKHRAALLAAERRAAAGTLASVVAHDLNNTLTVLQSDLERLRHGGDLAREHVVRLERSVDQVSALCKRLSRMGDTGVPRDLQRCDLAEIVRSTADLARRHHRVRHTAFEVEAADAVPVNGNPAVIHTMLLNLILNAADATDGHGRLLVRVHDVDGDAFLEVHDDGPGVEASERETIFEPFYTTKSGGSGLGLLSVKLAADVHHGNVEIGRSPFGGACFSVRIPQGEPVQTSAPDRPAVTPPGAVRGFPHDRTRAR